MAPVLLTCHDPRMSDGREGGAGAEPGRSGATASHDDCGSITRDQRPSLRRRRGQNVTGHSEETRGGNVRRW